MNRWYERDDTERNAPIIALKEMGVINIPLGDMIPFGDIRIRKGKHYAFFMKASEKLYLTVSDRVSRNFHDNHQFSLVEFIFNHLPYVYEEIINSVLICQSRKIEASFSQTIYKSVNQSMAPGVVLYVQYCLVDRFGLILMAYVTIKGAYRDNPMSR